MIKIYHRDENFCLDTDDFIICHIYHTDDDKTIWMKGEGALSAHKTFWGAIFLFNKWETSNFVWLVQMGAYYSVQSFKGQLAYLLWFSIFHVSNVFAIKKSLKIPS